MRESNLTTSPSKSGAGLPNLGNEFDKIMPQFTYLDKMYKVMPKKDMEVHYILKNYQSYYSKKAFIEEITSKTSESVSAG